MKKVVLIIVLGLAIACLAAELVDRIVAKVGSEIILLSDVYKQLQQMQRTGVEKELLTPGMVLQQIIQQKVITQKAKDLDIKIDADKAKKQAERYLRQIKSRYPSEEAFAADLAREKMTESELLAYYTELVKEQALTDQLIERYVTSQVKVSDQEMVEFYEATKDSLAYKPLTWETGMIMREIKPSPSSEAAKLAEIRDIQRRLNQGEDFATLASQVSDCPSKARGGDLGFFRPGMMVKPFEEAAFKLNVGEISDIVRTEYGFHLIRVEEKRTNEVRARHILKILSPTAADTLAAYEFMESIRARFAAGESFSALAGQYSEDPETANKGGIIGDLGEDEFPDLFANYILGTAPGEMTPVLAQEGMLYLFARLEALPERIYTYDEVKDKLREYLITTKQNDAYDEWVAKLISESYVQILEQ